MINLSCQCELIITMTSIKMSSKSLCRSSPTVLLDALQK